MILIGDTEYSQNILIHIFIKCGPVVMPKTACIQAERYCRDNSQIEFVLEFELLKVDYHPLFTAPTEW